MESQSRPPHRRKHANTFSLNNPYDDVLLSNGGKNKPFEAHEYSEIFSGSSSIPVLDLSGLDERVGSGDGRSSSKLDYTNIFGGLRNDDVAVPYVEVVSGSSTKKTKARIPTDTTPPLQESGSPHSSGKTNRSSPEASHQSVDGVKQQVNMSFNRTGQTDNDASNGKTHIAQLHAVPGFTYFVDGTSRLQKTEDERPIPSLKRGISRAWSFSAELESIKVKRGLSGNKSHMPDKSLDDCRVNLKSHFSNVPPSDDNDPRRSRTSGFVSKQDASEKIAGESSPSFFDEEFDETSVAAVSAAALKQAIDHAQESIRIAKMIMDRKKQGLQDGSKPSSRGCLKVKDKEEAKIGQEAYSSKEKIVRERKERPDLFNAGKVEVERVRENVGAAKEHADAFIGEGKISAPSCSQRENFQFGGKVELEKLRENVEAAEEHRVVTDFPGLVPNAEFRTQKLENGQVGKETFEQRTVNGGHIKGPDVVHKQSEMALDTPKRMEEPENSVKETLEQCQATLNHDKVHVHVDEQGKNVDETCENLRIIQENEVTKEGEIVTDDKETGEKKFEAYTEMLNESVNLVEKEKVEQEETGKDETVPEWKENGIRHGESDVEEVNVVGQKEAHRWFQSEEQLKEALEEEINETKPETLPEINDEKQNHADDENELMLPEILEQDEAEERHVNIYEYEATEAIMKEANNIVEAQKSDVLRDAEETNTVNEENHSEYEFQDFAYEKDIDEAVDVNNSDASTVFSESQEASDVDLTDQAEDYQKEVKRVPELTKTFSAIDKDKEADQLFHLEDNEMPEIDSLRRSASEEIFSESKLHDPFESPAGNVKTENFNDIEENNEEKLSDEDTMETICEVNDASQACTNKIDGQNLPQVDSSDKKTEEFDLAYLRQVWEQTLESDEGSASTSSVENTDSLSAHESEECVENAKEMTSNQENLKYEIDTTSNESKCNEKRGEEMDKHMETKRGVEKDLNVETNRESLANENMQNFDKDDHQQRIEAIRRGREREKDRIAVERAIREARERAFAEAREKAERAAVERVAAKLRAERAAVERATSEARERALEKAVSQKTFTEVKTQADKYPVERVSSSSRNNGLKHSFSFSDLDKFDGSNVEPAQRRKARLERHQRIMERAAKALAEKNMRDLLAQKEQAERNRLAESLDADIKRWATGKEGNLRALLSTLQYILGADSGWQPISLTEIITTAAVKKAYRKATLYVHPDKLQQRGATIQQKYICEKVFDLLKAAWNRFNSEER